MSASDRFHIPSLDGIRAVSFLIVFVAHAGLQKVVPGGFGVTVFFFLSGYLITTLLRLEHMRSGSISLKKFYLRRALRILPPFYLVLGLSVAAALLGWIDGGARLGPVAAQALHGANYWVLTYGTAGQPMGTGIYWSLAVEEHFYVLFPLFYLALRRYVPQASRQAVVLWGVCALILAWRCVLVYHLHSVENRTYMGSDTRFDSILFGCALATYGNPVIDGPSRVPERVWRRVLLPAGLAALLLTFVYRQPAFRETFRYSIQGLALTIVFVAAIRNPGWSFFRLLNTRAVSFMGVLSYSLYLVHHVVLGGVARHVAAPPIVQGVLAFAISLALAFAIYRIVERPCAKLRGRLASSAPRSLAGTPAR